MAFPLFQAPQRPTEAEILALRESILQQTGFGLLTATASLALQDVQRARGVRSGPLTTIDGYTEDQFREDLRKVHELHNDPVIAMAAGKAVERFDELIRLAREVG